MKRQSRKQWFAGLTAMLLMSLTLTVSAGSSLAFIPMGTADSVGVMDLESHRLTSTISGTVNTHGSALTPDGRYLIVGSLTAHDNQEAPVRPEGVTEDEHASHHGAQDGAAPKPPGSGRIYVVDTSTYEIDRVFEVPGPVHHVLVTKDGRYAVSTHPMGGGISVVDLDSGEAVALKLSEGAMTTRYEVGEAPHGLGLSADGQVLFATSKGDERIVRIELNHNSRKTVQLAPAPYHLAVSSVDGRILVTSRGEAKLWVLDPASLAIVDEVPLDGIGHQISIEAQ